MKSTHSSIIILMTILLSSCASTKTIKFTEQEDIIFKSSALRSFLNSNPSPTILLRVGETAYNLPEETTSNGLFHVISNELAASGYTVRDQQLFATVIDNQNNYAKKNSERKKRKLRKEGYEFVETNELENFIKTVSADLMNQLSN